MNKIIEQFNLLNNNEQIYLLKIILEGIKSAKELYLNILGLKLFDRLVKIDPSKTKKYLNWMCKQYIKRNTHAHTGEVTPYNMDVETFEKLIKDFDYRVNKGLIKNKDINYYKDIDELEDTIEKSQTKSETEYKEYIKSTESDIILDNDDYFIVEPLTWEASKIYGKGTKWCTASKISSDAWYSDVRQKGARIFYVRDKRLDIDNTEYRIAIYVPKYNHCGNKENIDYKDIPCKLYNAIDISTDSNLEEVSKRFGIDVNKIENIKYIDILTKEGVKEWLDIMEIKHYIIKKDLTVDVADSVWLRNKDLFKIPIQFGVVKGTFDCSGNNLNSLEFVPIQCEYFNCINNKKLSYEYLNNFDFSFVKKYLATNYGDINNKWNK